MVRTVKQLFNKAEETRTDPHLALLAYRATPLDNQTPSPAELLHNRKLRTTLVQKSSVTSPDIREKLLQRKEVMMKNSYRSLPPLVPEQNVRVQDPTTKRWNPGVIQYATPEPRSYTVKTPTGTVRRNRKHLRPTKETFNHFHRDTSPPPTLTSPIPTPPTPTPPSRTTPPQPASSDIPLRRSTRNIKPPDKLNL